MHLDHVALATRDAGPALATLVGELGALVVSGGPAIGYRPMQTYLGDEHDGMKIELLEPWAVESNDFLDRFLTRHGDGPHHLTFKVDDLEAALADVTAAGYSPVGIDLSTPIWREAFLQPHEAHGTVVQLAESSNPHKVPADDYRAALDGGPHLMGTQWWPDPPPRAPEPAVMRRVVMAAPSVPDALELFAGTLGGTPTNASAPIDPTWVELTWPGGGHLRVEERSDRGAGVDRVEVTGAGPTRELVVAGIPIVVNPALSR